MTEKVLLSIIVSPMVEDAMVDLLLEAEMVTGFTSFSINGHGSSIHSMSAAEQVAGRQRKTLFQTYLQQENLQALLDLMTSEFSGSGIHYWVTPLIEAGQL